MGRDSLFALIVWGYVFLVPGAVQEAPRVADIVSSTPPLRQQTSHIPVYQSVEPQSCSYPRQELSPYKKYEKAKIEFSQSGEGVAVLTWNTEYYKPKGSDMQKMFNSQKLLSVIVMVFQECPSYDKSAVEDILKGLNMLKGLGEKYKLLGYQNLNNFMGTKWRMTKNTQTIIVFYKAKVVTLEDAAWCQFSMKQKHISSEKGFVGVAFDLRYRNSDSEKESHLHLGLHMPRNASELDTLLQIVNREKELCRARPKKSDKQIRDTATRKFDFMTMSGDFNTRLSACALLSRGKSTNVASLLAPPYREAFSNFLRQCGKSAPAKTCPSIAMRGSDLLQSGTMKSTPGFMGRLKSVSNSTGKKKKRTLADVYGQLHLFLQYLGENDASLLWQASPLAGGWNDSLQGLITTLRQDGWMAAAKCFNNGYTYKYPVGKTEMELKKINQKTLDSIKTNTTKSNLSDTHGYTPIVNCDAVDTGVGYLDFSIFGFEKGQELYDATGEFTFPLFDSDHRPVLTTFKKKIPLSDAKQIPA